MIIFFLRYVSRGNKSETNSRAKNDNSTQRPIEMIHLDPFKPTRTMCIGHKGYSLFIVDEFTRWTCVKFLSHNESFKVLCKFF